MLFASDLHLTASDPAGVARFVRFAEGPCRDADRVLLLGDLFDFWVSPAQTADPGLRPVLRAVRGLVDRGVAVGFVEGNRDFAAAPELAALGVETLPDVGVVESRGLRVAFTHGDLLCTRDVRYQALRRVARRATVRHLLRSIPPRWALGIGHGARAGSRLETGRKAYGDMGLVAHAVASVLRRTEADALVCGHVHWGRRHGLEVDAAPRDVVVLSAWEDTATYARLEAGRLEFLGFEAGGASPGAAQDAPNPSHRAPRGG